MGACGGKQSDDDTHKWIYYSPRPGQPGGWYDENGEEYKRDYGSMSPGYDENGRRIPRPGQSPQTSPRQTSPRSPLPPPKTVGIYSPRNRDALGSPRDLFEYKAGAQLQNA
mmetsp:Transcript_28261/g.71730  ORF Transcript_28261/g.71730 Transcript_28261/m.71730 type:complete len:111 (+) Transcript_28261:170-502(+)|eukprot:CAMPEP_0178990002 /NCGR_PEP_ID=MMETSP0795-20121207/4688_1 /TAXON_ID=88552 /ORGANISM="Amoebophrya sp., Strain Ameob2" /LENGTH=110 /DNA_ID=CAMNT_0020681467 /DNA_START=81 /DNA_END=413 /DNA_ORIENTATION=+